MLKIMRGIVILAGILLIFMLITACSSDKAFVKRDNPEENRNFKVMQQGEKYTYNESENDSEFRYDSPDIKDNNNTSDDERFYQTGYASWYGREFHGRKTASGDRFDMNKLTAAHKKLPFGTQLIVKNLENGNSVRVIVNDRGPYRDGRIIDLSYAAARKLGILASGEAKVGLTILRKGDNYPLAKEDKYERINAEDSVVGVAYNNKKGDYDRNESDNNSYDEKNTFMIQAGAFYSRRNAERLQKRIEDIVDNPVIIFSENDMYKIRIEKISSKSQANRIKSMLNDRNISSFIVENME